MKPVKTLIYSILAGACIALGGTVFLMVDNNILGSLFFTIGLFTICTFGFNLYTGKVCYALDNKADYILTLVLIWFGNLLGTMIIALLEKFTRTGSKLFENAQALADVKLNDSMISLFILGIFCNVCIYIAVDGFKNNPHELGKYLSLFFGVMVFIICGFEHSVADMYYISMASAWSGHAVLSIIVISLGNAVGGLAIPVCKKLAEKNKD